MPRKQIRISEIIIPKYLSLFNDKTHRHIILTSGRAGTKSSYAAVRSDFQLINDPGGSVVVLRKHHNKLRKTVYKEMLRGINRLGIDKKAFRVGISPMEISYRKYGTTMYFAGSDGIDDTKGIIDENKPIKLVVLDELTEFFDDGEGEDELQNIEATFIRGNSSGFQMIYLYNPPKNPNALINKWCRKMEKRSDCIHIHTDYRDVPEGWLGKDLIESAEIMKAADERQYRWVWLGQSIGVDEAIYYMFSDKHKEKPEKKRYRVIGIGVDYGQQNATVYEAAGVDEYEKRLKGIAEYYYSGRETGKQKSPSDYARDFIVFTDRLHEEYECSYFYVFIDPSAKGLSEEIKRAARDCDYTVLIRDADNDVELGISRVQKLLTYKIMTVSPLQEKAVEEFGTYEYDKKSIERGKEVPVKVDDHCMDAIRYLVMGFWKKIKHWLPVKEYEKEYRNPIDEEVEDEYI